MSLRVHNTMSGRKELFEPIDAKNVRLYVCGPTVYDYAHIGNARPYVVFDILFRMLRRAYGDAHVTYARNITDIDDKIMARAVKEGKTTAEIADYYTGVYHHDLDRLNVLKPTIEPKATDHLPEMIAMMQVLIGKGHAYEAEGHVLFDVPSMKDYGKLSHRPMDEMIAGARVEVAPYKKNPQDFVMWKPSSDDQPGWDSPWGRGRPGWHLECSSMIEKHLGETIDIHAGGVDLVFPHHENEVAQSECAHGETFVKYWMHNGYLVFGGGKMSKSEGNIQTIDGLLKKFGYKGGEALRLMLLTAHYRQPLDFSDEIVIEQRRRLDRWYRVVMGTFASPKVPEEVIQSLEDDLNTPKAIAAMEKLADKAKRQKFASMGRVGVPHNRAAADLRAACNFLGLMEMSPDEWFKGREVVQKKPNSIHLSGSKATVIKDVPGEAEIQRMIDERYKARSEGDYETADRIRIELEEIGVILEDSPTATEWRRKD
ncbi:MAG: cysteine--tRNA ligase [Proteobacteria bacterium]|nr:cysteine--tRNA ligase [Pseudomonadota bacterium]